MAAPSTLALREIQPPPGRYVAHAPPSFASEAGKARIAARDAAYEAALRARHRCPYKGARWTYDLYTLARADARDEKTRRLRRRAWYSRPGYTGLDRVLPRAFAGLRAVST